ncbi:MULTISPECIES: EF-P 5-aminopentanol modification-associated protein YfmH [Bacillaceae]|uniref:EF-P 5-aminopentanol modification-associated protein YfmH n=1 Tax=Bacillaceae TaxID=186817 RepID=UPI000BEBA204|nr:MULTISPECIES: pitrilysin family protein [unclassified Bacillus (in: firmicutes)]PEC49701.1 peptidase M16 [Bacillus sp. AFS096315]PFM79624.1 peptidase M16 [Bacillus sp. AFS077874]
MEKKYFEQLNETLYFEELENGLKVYILPKQGYNKTYATFTTKYGSIDSEFIPLGKDEKLVVPDGIAHFLEHKLFEKKDGDVFQVFSKQGASSNAFTSFTRTAYLFSATNNVEQNLMTLIDFVQDPYFSDQSVEKEKGIIGQEIKMYEDNPDWRQYFGMIANLYGKHPVRTDIAGTVESISKITKELLYTCYETFYHPSNMLFFVVGPVDPDKTMNLIKENQSKKTFKDANEIKRFFPEETPESAEKKKVLHMNVQSSKVLVGVKDFSAPKGGSDLLKHELSISVLLDYLFGKGSNTYQQMYEDGLIDDTFSYDYSAENGFAFAIIGGDSTSPEKLSEKIKEVLLDSKNHQWEKEIVDRVVKKKIGGFLRSLNSPEYIANQFTRYAFLDMHLFDIVSVLQSISVEDLKESASHLINEDYMSEFFVLPH